MDLQKVPDDQKLRLCKTYFFAGFALLPFVWLVNCVWFFWQGFCRKPAFPQQQEIKKYVIFSTIGCAFWTILFVAWNVVFQINRASWGAMGDYLSFVYPKGQE